MGSVRRQEDWVQSSEDEAAERKWKKMMIEKRKQVGLAISMEVMFGTNKLMRFNYYHGHGHGVIMISILTIHVAIVYYVRMWNYFWIVYCRGK